MYNLYTYEKQERDKIEKVLNQKKEKQKAIQKKTLNEQLKTNYQNRVKNFIFEMAENPITITDYKNPIDCVFNKYDDHLRPKALHHKSSQPSLKTKTITESNSPSKKESNNHILTQPRMRFKAKSDIERVIEERIKQNKQVIKPEKIQSYVKTEIVFENKVSTKNDKYEILLDHDSSQTVVIRGESDGKKTNIHRRDCLSKIKQKYLDKTETQMLVKLYKQNKTHFKGMNDIAVTPGNFFQEKTRNKSNKLEKSRSEIKNHFYSTLNNEQNIIEKESFSHINTELIMKNPLLFKIDKTSGNLNKLSKENFDPSAVEKVKEISLSPTLKENWSLNRQSLKKVNFIKFLKKPRLGKVDYGMKKGILFGLFKDIDILHRDFIDKHKNVEEDKILIDDEEFRKSDTEKIANKVLKVCNYYHKKNANNNKNLKSGEGKLMITNGLTLNEFNKKFKLN